MSALAFSGQPPKSENHQKISSINLEAEYKGLSEINKEKIYAKIIKRRGQEPNIKTMFDFDGKTGLITGKDEPQASTQKEDSENDSFF